MRSGMWVVGREGWLLVGTVGCWYGRLVVGMDGWLLVG